MDGQIDFARLSAPFDADEIEWRVQSCGMKEDMVWARVMPYITARAIMDRLDEVCGPQNWVNSFERGPDGGVICAIAIRYESEWVRKWDGTDQAETDGVDRGGQKIDRVKTALTCAFKRAAVKWAIGRYLYKIGPQLARVHSGGRFYGKTKDGVMFRWDPPAEGQKLQNIGRNNHNPGGDVLDIDKAKAAMDAAKTPQELLDWFSRHCEGFGRCMKAATAYFNQRMETLKKAA